MRRGRHGGRGFLEDPPAPPPLPRNLSKPCPCGFLGRLPEVSIPSPRVEGGSSGERLMTYNGKSGESGDLGGFVS